MTQPPAKQTTYCLNPNCPEPQQVNQTLICPRCGSRILLGDRYRAIQLLGEGASGKTWLAIDQQPTSENRTRNCILQQSPSPIDHLSLFQNRQQWRKLGQHPQIPNLLNYVEQNACVYCIQEYTAGESLAKILADRGKFNAAEVWAVLESLLPVLQFIHSQGVIHRDIKPDNIIRCSSLRAPQENGVEDLVLVDFKAAILFRGASANPFTDQILSSQKVMGSVYAAPEQIRGQATFASDLYSLGVTCIHLLTDVHPFHLMDVATHTWIWQNYWMPESIHTADHLTQQHLAQFLDRLIAPDLNQRFTSPTEAITTLQKLRGKRSPIPKIVPVQSVSWMCYATLIGHEGLFANINAVAIVPDSQTVASASDDKTIRLWNGQTGAEIGVLQGHTQFVTTIAFHPQNAEILVSGSRDRTIKLWNWQDRQEICTLTGHDKSVNSVLITDDGRWLISGSADKTVKVWQVDSGILVASLTGHRLAINALVYHAAIPGYDYPVLASASTDTTVKLWNLDSFACTHTLSGHTAAVKAIAFSPSGQWLATAGEDRTIRLWNVVSRQCCQILPGHSWSVSSLVFTADGETLISSSEDKTIKLWQVSTGQEMGTLTGHTDAVSGVTIAPDQSFLASSSYDKTLKLWKIRSTL